jgi:hypothetical protein
MSPPVKKRMDYTRDAQVLVRIARAVKVDETRPADWRDEQYHKLTELITAFMAPFGSKPPVVKQKS